MTIDELKKHIKKASESTISSVSKQDKQKDERFWEPTITDKDTKMSRAIIRPISCVATEESNVVVQTSHFIKRNNKNYSFICPRTGGGKCPVCERYYSKAYGERDNEYKPKKRWIMNIYVVEDSGKPENNGKTFLWACPKTIWDKIESARTAEYEDERVENIFDMWDGANLLIRTRDKGGFMNYDDSQIRSKSALFPNLPENDPKYIQVAESAYPLAEFTNPKNLKSYSDVAELLNEIDGLVDDKIDTNPSAYVAKHVTIEEDDTPSEEIREAIEEDVAEDDFFSDDTELVD